MISGVALFALPHPGGADRIKDHPAEQKIDSQLWVRRYVLYRGSGKGQILNNLLGGQNVSPRKYAFSWLPGVREAHQNKPQILSEI